MGTRLKIFIILIIFVILTVAFSSSYSTVNIDNIAIVVAMGIDLDENNKLNMSFQYTNSSTNPESGSSESPKSIIKTVNASSINSAINIMNSQMGKELSLSHCKLIVFSEKIAKQGIADEIYTLINDIQIRPSTNIVISKCSAEYYISNSKPVLEPLISKYYELFLNSSQYTGYTSNATIGEFFDKMICNSCTPYAILGGVNLQLSDDSKEFSSTIEATSKSNHSNLSGSITSENIGLAVFDNGVMTGELNAIETLSFMCLTNKINGFLITIPNPSSENGYLDVYLKHTKNSKIDVSLVNGSPFIKIECDYNGQIYSMSKDSNYLNSETLDVISNTCNRYLEYIFENYLYRTSKELKSDINGFGTHSLKLFLTSEEYKDYDWNSHYQDSFFDVSVDVNVKSASLLSDT